MAAKSEAAFYRHLPELLKDHCRKWVAYHGDECLGFARTQTELYKRCVRRGYKDDEFVVMWVDYSSLYDHDPIEPPSGAW
jgi:hypothetical protein